MTRTRPKEEDLIRNLAWSFHKTTGIDVDELIGEASIAYCKARNDWDKVSCKFSTYAFRCITNHLITYIGGIKEERRRQCEMMPYLQVPSRSHASNFVDFLHSLPKDAKEVVQAILSAPRDFLSSNGKLARRKVLGKCLMNGWSIGRAEKAIRTVKIALNHI